MEKEQDAVHQRGNAPELDHPLIMAGGRDPPTNHRPQEELRRGLDRGFQSFKDIGA